MRIPIPPREKSEIAKQRRRARGTVKITVTLRPDEPPEITASRHGKWQDLNEAQRALSDAWMYRGTFANPNEGARKVWEDRKQHEVRQRARASAFNAEHPWECEFCPRRFKTEHGCKIHERHCRKRPQTPDAELVLPHG